MRFKSLLWGSFTSMSHLCVFSWSRNFTFSFILHMCVFSTFFRKLQLLRTTSWRRTDLLDPYLIFYFCRINKFIFWIAFKTLLAGVIKWKILFGRLHFRKVPQVEVSKQQGSFQFESVRSKPSLLSGKHIRNYQDSDHIFQIVSFV